jgi:hypothetical protein
MEYTINLFGPLEKWVVAPPEKTTRTGEVDGPVICLLVQSLEANVPPGRLLGTITMRLIVKLIEPVPRKLFTRDQAIAEFGGGGNEGIQSSDITAQRDGAFNQTISDADLMNIYIKKKGRRIPYDCKCAFPLAVNYRISNGMRLLGLSVINESLIEEGVRVLGMAERLPLSMGIFGQTYNDLLCGSWGNVDTVNGMKSILCRNSNENSPGHENRLNKFGAYPITHRMAQWDVMQRNGRAKTVESQTGNWTFHQGQQEIVIAKGGLYAVANRLDIHDWHSTPEDAVPYFTGDDFGAYANIHNFIDAGGCYYGTGMLGVDFPVEFVFGECLMGQLPIYIRSKTDDTTGPFCWDLIHLVVVVLV